MPERITFYCEGTEEQVAWFLAEVAKSVATLPVEHLQVQKDLLRAEACHANAGAPALHDMWRWGAQGHGLTAFDGWASIT